jgi:uncharacterized protein
VHWQWPAGALCGFLLALVTTPAGVSGAVLLLPVQVSVLRVPSPSVTPTNLLFNVFAVPGGLLRFWREGRLFGPLASLLLAGTLPGVVIGAILRVEVLAGAHAFMFIAAGVLFPLGIWLLLGSQRIVPEPREPNRVLIGAASLAVGVVGGIYGIGGGSLLAPMLLAAGFSAYEVAPATLLATFATSVVGIATFASLQVLQGGNAAPDWVLGIWIGAGGFAGSYWGARLQSRIPERSLRRLLGVIACVIAARYAQEGIESSRAPRPAHTGAR